ncbi:uncharacterized protein METZ01_LOCUS496689 [marine metagenome]|uniref:Uncharacterized protein n=1 Tax=marine metagenome TaxID=408172 RepID=A0A383DHV6_9ZZZZ
MARGCQAFAAQFCSLVVQAQYPYPVFDNLSMQFSGLVVPAQSGQGVGQAAAAAKRVWVLPS